MTTTRHMALMGVRVALAAFSCAFAQCVRYFDDANIRSEDADEIGKDLHEIERLFTKIERKLS